MIDTSEIEFEAVCRYNKTGRIFYARGRVFRTVAEKVKDRYLEFLQSDLCKYLISEGLLVNTWIAEDVSVPGFPLILEHEPLFCSRYKDWSFEMRKAAGIAAARIVEISQRYGYGAVDPHIGNFAFSNGRMVYFDFGSFFKDSQQIRFEANKILTYHYLMLKLISTHNNCLYLSTSTTILPKEKVEESPTLFPIIRRNIDKYDVYHHESRHFLSRIGLLYRAVPTINKIVCKLYHRTDGNDIFKRRLVFKQLHKSDFEKIKNPYNKQFIYPIEDSSIIRCTVNLLKDGEISFNNVMCVGNFSFPDLEKLQMATQGNVNVVSLDSIYLDTLTKDILLHPCKVNPIVGDIVIMETDRVQQYQYAGDLVIIQDQLSIPPKGKGTPTLGRIYPYTEYLSRAIRYYCRKYLLIPSETPQEILDKIEDRFTLKSKLSHTDKEYLLFEVSQNIL